MIGWVALALAHEPGISFTEVGRDRIALTFAREELAAVAPMDDLDAARLLVREATLDRVRVSVDGVACGVGEATLGAVEGDGVRIEAPLACPEGPRTLTLGFFDALRPGHRSYAESGGLAAGVLDAGSPVADLGHPPTTAQIAGRFLHLGVEHIWTGYDHLAFLFGLLLVAASLREMLLVVTGFTIAHSVTLTLAAMGVVTLPSALVEASIALSIAWVGVENLFRPPARRRMVVTFLLGFLHGFGFAGLLAELGLPDDAVVAALLAFNGGVELGQAALVALALPVLLWLRRRAWWTARAVPALSVAVALAGVGWFVERVWAG